MADVLRALQGGLESLYRINTDLDVRDFLVESESRDEWQVTRAAKEQLLIRHSGGNLELGLFVDEATLENLRARNPAQLLDDDNLQDFLYALEGVSHFVYFVHRARADRPVSAVELELQAEVDKYLVALLVSWDQNGDPPEDLPERLFRRIRYADDLSDEEQDRYRLANQTAKSYAEFLELRFVRPRARADLLCEARQFYRKGLAGKLAHITKH